MYALVEIKGKQYKVEKDSRITVDRIDSEAGAAVEFDNVVMVRDDAKVTFGTPYVSGAVVKASVERHDRNAKVMVFKHKRRKNYRRTRGHRQHVSVLHIQDIAGV
jgi:large subunit ribosomal protein L21